jgi:hypothetical protein
MLLLISSILQEIEEPGRFIFIKAMNHQFMPDYFSFQVSGYETVDCSHFIGQIYAFFGCAAIVL